MWILFTIIWVILFWAFMLMSLLILIPYGVIVLINNQKITDQFVYFFTRIWAKYVLFTMGASVEVRGEENIPDHNRIILVSNHNGYLDIPLIMSVIPKMIGFVAKVELIHFPIISIWMKTMHCVFMDRKNVRESLKLFEKASKQIDEGHPLVIFPEGTRSKGKEMKHFKAGSFKLATRSNGVILPMTIEGTENLLEKNRFGVKPAKVLLTIHPPIELNEENNRDTQELAKKTESVIRSGFSQ